MRDDIDFTTLLRTIPQRFPLSPEACRGVLELAAGQSTLEARVLLSRLFWLAGGREDGGMGLMERQPRYSAHELAKAVVFPREPVFEAIAQRSGLGPDFLRKVFEGIYTKGTPGNIAQLADISEEGILQEMKWWLTDLSFPEYYFKNTSPALIARQILMNRAYELAGIDSEAYSRMKVSSTALDGTTMHWVHRDRSLEVEEEIEREYYAGDERFNVSAYAPLKSLLLYTVYRDRAPAGADGFEASAPRSFLEQSESEARARYDAIRREAIAADGIVVSRSVKAETGERRIMIGFPREFIQHFQANISRVMARNGIEVTRKYTVTFGGPKPVIIASLYADRDFPEDLLAQLVAVGLYPPGEFAALVEGGEISPEQAILANAIATFVHQFITVPDPDVGFLAERFRADSELTSVLSILQARIDRDAFRSTVVTSALADRPDIIRDLWAVFAAGEGGAARVRLEAALGSQQLAAEEADILAWSLRFLDSIEGTNFFLPVKGAVAFKISSSFFAGTSFAEPRPYGVFYVVGRDFHGFHLRFKDIARGGVRILRSRTWDDWVRNCDALFEEGYNLACTQDKKNKDIPEGGSQGIVLTSVGASDREAEQAFYRYVDALLDLLLPLGAATGEARREEILFLGPDEGTATLMDWACRRARDRGYRYWKGFATGKGAGLGGISHRDYGMTIQGMHRYVLGILERLGIDEGSITKAQIGGPDGDLGGNEILASRDRTIAVVDGSGVLYDPEGLDREELARLARAREPSSGYDDSLLGGRGFKVGLSDRDRRLPGGELVASGLGFRNGFHLDSRLKADLFLPCGGRPKSINLTNWKSLLGEDGEPRFRWIVEGANLFIAQEARLKLEEKGVLIFKDSSANKGGVISSSLEVLAGLALTDAEYEALMVVHPGGSIPEFRERYVAEVAATIRRLADSEFRLLWEGHEGGGPPLSRLSEALSERIAEITRAIEGSALFENEAVRRGAFRRYIPKALLERIGMDAVLERVPESYQRAIFARAVASGFIYRFGLDVGFEDYRLFIEELASAD